jgi:signal transduction histidine kinase
VTRTIRSRIALWAFAVLLALIGLQSALVLGGLDRALREVADRELRSELEALSREGVDARLVELQRTAADPDTNLSDLVFELRDALEQRYRARDDAPLYLIRRADDVVARSRTLAGRDFGAGGRRVERGGVVFRDVADPRRPDAPALRVAALVLGPYRVELARSLGPFASIHQATRMQLLVILAVVSAVGGLGAYWIARRALTPVRQLVDEAKRLRTLSEGVLPRTGRADEIDDLAEVLNGLLERVRADVLRIQRFTADAAHEIRTPLAAIRGHLELLLEKVDADAQATLASVLEEVERMARLVSQLLLLETLQRAPDPLERSRVDLGALAAELVEHLRVLAEDQGVELAGEFPEAPVLGDPGELRQVLLNLIDNALKFTPSGGRIDVDVAVDSARGVARVRVRDTGPGVAAADVERVFERFASDRSRSEAGTGLGLAIARAIARAHGGDLRVEPGAGATFQCELPLADRAPEEAP